MFTKAVKKVLLVFLAILLFFAALMPIPRVWSALNPKKAPMGYYFEIHTMVALFTGLESMIDKDPRVSENVIETKDIEYKNINGKSLQL